MSEAVVARNIYDRYDQMIPGQLGGTIDISQARNGIVQELTVAIRQNRSLSCERLVGAFCFEIGKKVRPLILAADVDPFQAGQESYAAIDTIFRGIVDEAFALSLQPSSAAVEVE